MNHSTVAHIDLEALHHNLRTIKTATPRSNILVMIKSNAYGHGVVEVAKSLEHDVDAFGVMFLHEALQLYNAGVKKTIVILTGFFDAEELSVIEKYNFECSVHNFAQIEILEKAKLSRPLGIWLKIDTGMHRLGFQSHQVQEAYQRLVQNKMVQKPLRLMTHFSDADNVKNNKTAKQIVCFEQIVANLEGEWCMANSAAIFGWPKSHVHWIRPGIALYGASPFDGKSGPELNLKPVMTLTSRIITIHELEKGASVGYGSTFSCPEKMKVGTISIGYGHGYPRNARFGTPVLVNGIRTQLVGRVAMDMIGIDLRKVPKAKIGSSVILWGKGLPVEEIAANAGEISYELFCRLTSRVHYQFYQRSVDINLIF
ncbi:alanine racemase 1 [Gammaproteobacteria bacterium]